jgi:hypothetical protein
MNGANASIRKLPPWSRAARKMGPCNDGRFLLVALWRYIRHAVREKTYRHLFFKIEIKTATNLQDYISFNISSVTIYTMIYLLIVRLF